MNKSIETTPSVIVTMLIHSLYQDRLANWLVKSHWRPNKTQIRELISYTLKPEDNNRKRTDFILPERRLIVTQYCQTGDFIRYDVSFTEDNKLHGGYVENTQHYNNSPITFKMRTHYDNGRLEGPAERHLQDGTVLKANFVRNAMTGNFTSVSDKVKAEADVVDDKIHGQWSMDVNLAGLKFIVMGESWFSEIIRFTVIEGTKTIYEFKSTRDYLSGVSGPDDNTYEEMAIAS